MKATISALLLTYGLATAADVGGNWKGTTTAGLPEGKTRINPVLLVLKQDGDSLTGTVGEDAEDQRPLAKGKITADQITFEVPSGDSYFRVTATVSGDSMNGAVSHAREGQVLTVKLDLKRESGNVTGVWSGTLSPEGSNELPLHFVFRQDGRSLTGTGGPGPEQQIQIESGIADGNQLTFEVPMPAGLLRFNVNAKGDELDGKATRERDGNLQSAKVKANRKKT